MFRMRDSAVVVIDDACVCDCVCVWLCVDLYVAVFGHCRVACAAVCRRVRLETAVRVPLLTPASVLICRRRW